MFSALPPSRRALTLAPSKVSASPPATAPDDDEAAIGGSESTGSGVGARSAGNLSARTLQVLSMASAWGLSRSRRRRTQPSKNLQQVRKALIACLPLQLLNPGVGDWSW
eukprot:GHVU01081256.1.p1 GENE.GHVU01081256.1~~GHVU01081256.1.p1  ORF type:complete len:109 (+),score=6.56 GHVU01081256.1:44-370(+)